MAWAAKVTELRQFVPRWQNCSLAQLGMGLASLLAAFLILYPLYTLILGSFQQTDDWGEPVGFTLQHYRKAIEPRFLMAFANTLIISVGTSLLAGFLGIALAWINARTNSFGARALEPFNLIPFYLSPLVGSIAWTYLASPSVGILNQWLRGLLDFASGPLDIYSRTGIVWVMGLFYTPYMYLFTVGSFRKMDPALEEAARTAGSGMLETTVRVTLPLMLPGILFGLSLTFVTSMGLFSVPAALGLPVRIEVFATALYGAIEGSTPNYNLGAALGMFVLGTTFAIFLAQRKILLPREFTTVTGKGYRPGVIDLGKWKYLTFAFQLLYLLAAVILPILALFIVSISQAWLGQIDLSRLTWEHYFYVLVSYPLTQRGISNSLFLGFFGATAAMILCFVLAYTVHHLEGKPKASLDFLLSMPIGMPAILLSMGVLVAYIKTPLYGTLWLLLLAYVTRYLPLGVKNVSSILLSISQELEDSSRLCGARWFTTARRILVPLVKPGLLSGWIVLFLIFMRELNASILLYSEGNEVMSVILFLLLQDAPAPQIAAYSMIQTLMMLVIMYVIRKVADPDDVAG